MESTETSRSKPSSRERLLEAARQLFYEQGYNATTLAQISEKSGVNNGLITYYFGTKNNLAQEIYNLFLMNVRAEISMRLFEKKKEFNMALNIAVENRMLLSQKFENPKLLRFYNEYQRGSDSYSHPNPRREVLRTAKRIHQPRNQRRRFKIVLCVRNLHNPQYGGCL